MISENASNIPIPKSYAYYENAFVPLKSRFCVFLRIIVRYHQFHKNLKRSPFPSPHTY